MKIKKKKFWTTKFREAVLRLHHHEAHVDKVEDDDQKKDQKEKNLVPVFELRRDGLSNEPHGGDLPFTVNLTFRLA